MLQIEHIYEFLFQNLFFDFKCMAPIDGVPKDQVTSFKDFLSFEKHITWGRRILFSYDQEPLLEHHLEKYYTLLKPFEVNLIHSEAQRKKKSELYYFYHGFAALDWYRGYHALNFNKPAVNPHDKDFISYNRLTQDDRSYRIYFVSQLIEKNLIDKGAISFAVSDTEPNWTNELLNNHSKLSEKAKKHIILNLQSRNIEKLVIDKPSLSGDHSADILSPHQNLCEMGYPNNINVDAFWHIVTETVFYYDKLHLTEKIFKPIVSKQPFMLLAAPGNLKYLRSYGFKTFEGIIDESYDSIKDNDARIEAVVTQLKWYCDLTDDEKTEIQRKCEPIIEHNFHHFYGKFKEIITDELLDNSKKLFKELNYDDSDVDYATVRKLLIS